MYSNKNSSGFHMLSTESEMNMNMKMKSKSQAALKSDRSSKRDREQIENKCGSVLNQSNQIKSKR